MYKIQHLKNNFIQNTNYYYLKSLEHYTNLNFNWFYKSYV